MSDSKFFTGHGMYRSFPKRKAKKKVSAKKTKSNYNETRNNSNETKNNFKNKASEENSNSEVNSSLKTKKKSATQNSTANKDKKKPTTSHKSNRKPKDYSNCSISNTEEKKKVSKEKAFEEIDDLPLSSLQPSSVNTDTKKRKCKKIVDTPPNPIKKDFKPKPGCQCGSMALNPSNLTCCGQRCICYSKNRPCVNCKCKGCRNTIKFDGMKDAAATLPLFDAPPIIDNDPTSFEYNESESGIVVSSESSPLAVKPIENDIPISFDEEAQPALELEPTPVSSLESLSLIDQNIIMKAVSPFLQSQAPPTSSLMIDQGTIIKAVSPYICPNLLSNLAQAVAAMPTETNEVPKAEPDPESDNKNFNKLIWEDDDDSVIEVDCLRPPGACGNPIDVDNDSSDSVIEVTPEAHPLQELSVSSSQIIRNSDDSPIFVEATVPPPGKRRKMGLQKEPELIEISDTESTASDVVSVYSEGNGQPVPSPLFTEEDMHQLQTMLEEESGVPLPLPYRSPPPPVCRISRQRRRQRTLKAQKSLNLRCIPTSTRASNASDLPTLSPTEQEAVIQDIQQILSNVSEF